MSADFTVPWPPPQAHPVLYSYITKIPSYRLGEGLAIDLRKEMMAVLVARDPGLMARLYPKKHEMLSVFQMAAKKRAEAAAAVEQKAE
jgi:hypothetical protein